MICEICGKKPTYGVAVTHRSVYVTGRSNRVFKPNIQVMTVVEHGVKQRVKACTRCMRTMTKTNRPRQ